MLTIDDIRRRGSIADELFRKALTMVGSRWEDLVFLEDPGAPIPGQRNAWSARDVAEHALSIERINLDAAVRTVQEKTTIDLFKEMRRLTDFDWGNRSLTDVSLDSAAAAADELVIRLAERTAFLRAIGPDELAMPAGMSPPALKYMDDRGVPVTNTVGGLLAFCSEHILDHGEQIQRAFG